MKTPSLPWFGLFAFSLALSPLVQGASAASPDIKKQIAEIRELVKPAENDTQEARQVKSAYMTFLRGLDRSLAYGRALDVSLESYGNLEEMGLKPIPEVQEKINAVLQELKKQIEDRDRAKIEEGEALLARIGKTLLEATKPEDLDDLLKAVSPGERWNSDHSDPKLGTIAARVQSSKQLITLWQDYLIDKNGGDVESVWKKLGQISNLLAENPMVPRSVVLRMQQENVGGKSVEWKLRNGMDEIRKEMMETGDTELGLKRLREIPKSATERSSEYVSLLRLVEGIEEIRKLEPILSEAETLAGLRSMLANQGQNRLNMLRAIDRVALNALSRSYNISPAPDVRTISARAVVENIAKDALARKDYALLHRALNSLEGLASSSHYGEDNIQRHNDMKIIGLIQMGKAAEEKKDVETAASSYLEATFLNGRFLGPAVPYEMLGDLKVREPQRVGEVIAKAEAAKQQNAVARYTAELEVQRPRPELRQMEEFLRSSNLSAGYPRNQETYSYLKPLVEEAVAKFLRARQTGEQDGKDEATGTGGTGTAPPAPPTPPAPAPPK